MPRGTPTLGSGSTVLGTVKDDITTPGPQGETTQWEGITVTEPPPPWELVDNAHALSDARRFVTAPANVEVRWINPRVLDSMGWRDWQPVMASDPRFTVRVHTMVSPEGNIRRGGNTGDILAWMYKSWVVARRKQNADTTARMTEDAVNQQEILKEEFKRGGRGLSIDTAVHPRFTSGDGRTMQD